LTASITAADISNIGTAKVTVVNPAANGGTSSPSTFFVGTSGGANFAVITLNQSAQDIAFDPVNDVFYLSVTGTATSNPNTISVLDPSTGAVITSVPAGSNPNVLAISGNSKFLYAGIDGASSVQRLTLPGLAKDISYSLGGAPTVALDLVVAPAPTPPHTAAAHTTAVAVGNPTVSPAAGGITIFDDATPRTLKATNGLFSTIQWGADATKLFSANGETSGFDFYTLSVSSNGAAIAQDFSNRFSSYGNKIHFDPGTNLIYGDDGQVVDPNGVPAGVFDSSSIFNPSLPIMTPDSALNTAFFAGQTFSLNGVATFTIQSFDLTHYAPITSIHLTGVTGNPVRLIRWGTNGLAFNTTGGQVFFVAGNFVSPAPSLNLIPPPTPATPPTPAANAPTISSLLPSSAVAGGAAVAMNVSGTNFVSTSMVQFNGNALATTFVSGTQLTATIPATDISSVGTASITVANPSANGGISAPSTFFVGTTGGTSSAGTSFAVSALSQASKDIVFDSAHRVIYLSVPGTVPGIGNTVSVLDPFTSKIVGEQFAGSNPNLLAISGDGQFLYASIDGTSSVQRLTLPSLATDIKYDLGAHSFFGPYTALDLQVAPGASHTTAVTLANAGFSPSAQGGITIFDDAAARPMTAPGFGSAGGGLFDSPQWGSDATTLFAANYEDTGFDFYTLAVNTSGVSLTNDYPGAVDGSRIHFSPGTNLVYCDNGRIIDPSNGTNPGSFSTSGISRMVPDSALNTAFFVSVSGTTATVLSSNLTTRTLIASITIPNVTGNPQRLVRWGQNALAFNTDGGQIYLIGGNFVH
jgi:YVTN family beta-propeller protein